MKSVFLSWIKEQGLNAIPLKERGENDRGKRPDIPSWAQYQKEKFPLDKLQNHSGNVGIICGQVSGGLVVVDVDSKEIFNKYFKDFSEGAPIVETANGFHVYYKTNEKLKKGNLQFFNGETKKFNIDIQAEASYVVAPSSIHETGFEYKFANNIRGIPLFEGKIKQKLKGLAGDIAKKENLSLKGSIEKKPVDVEKLKQGVQEGTRDISALKYATYLRKKGYEKETAKQKLIEWNKQNKPPLSESEILKCLNSAFRGDPYNYKFKQDTKRKEEMSYSEMAEWIIAQQSFKTALPHETLYMYKNGIYTKGGAHEIKKFAKQLKVDLTRHGAGEVLHHIKILTGINQEEFNKDKNLIWLENGIFNLETGQLQDFTSELVSLNKLPVEYQKGTDCPRFKEFLEEIVENKEDVLGIQELFGYCLLQDYRFRKFWLLYGSGFNGKSTLLLVLEGLLGKENTSNVSLHSLSSNRFASARLYGKKANICADISSVKIKTADTIKMLSGNDNLDAEFKGRDSFSFKNYAKLVFSANEIPEVNDHSDAFFERSILINFPYCFKNKAVPNLHEKLLKEKSGIFNWAYTGLKRLLEQKGFSNELTTEEARNIWLLESTPVVDFVNEYCVLDLEESIDKNVLYGAYVNYCKNKKIVPKKKNSFSMQLFQQFSPKVDTSQPRDKKQKTGRRNAYLGISLKDNGKGGKGISNILRKELRSSKNNIQTLCTKEYKKTPSTPAKNEEESEK